MAARTLGAEASQQRGVLARVIGVGGGGVAPVVSREHQQVVGAHQREPLPHGRVDLAQSSVETDHVVAVAVDLVCLDQVGEHEAAAEASHQLGGVAQRGLVGGPWMLDIDAEPAEQLARFAHRVHLETRVVELL